MKNIIHLIKEYKFKGITVDTAHLYSSGLCKNVRDVHAFINKYKKYII